MTESELREVYSAADTPEAHFVKASLEEVGIEASVVGDILQNAVGDLPAVAIAPRVWVRSEDFDRARKIIQDHQDQQRSGRVSTGWKCSRCGEPNEPTFDVCWNCQASRTVSE